MLSSVTTVIVLSSPIRKSLMCLLQELNASPIWKACWLSLLQFNVFQMLIGSPPQSLCVRGCTWTALEALGARVQRRDLALQALGSRLAASGRTCNLLGMCTGVEVASGLHRFLKKACKSSISWRLTGGNQIDTACLEREALEATNLDIYQERSTPWSYYQNVVTPRWSMLPYHAASMDLGSC